MRITHTTQLTDLAEWLSQLLEHWDGWARTSAPDGWLATETNNPRHPTVGHLLEHAWSTLEWYSAQVAGHPDRVDRPGPTDDWDAMVAWARPLLGRFSDSVANSGDHDRVMDFRTRSAGVLRTTAAAALTHAVTHAVWHLGGVVHVLRSKGIAPPAKNDLIHFCLEP